MHTRAIILERSLARSRRVQGVIAWAAIALIWAQPAFAVTLSNNDSKVYKVTVTFKAKSEDHQLAPGKRLVGFCKSGCVIRLNGSAADEYELEGTERVSIESGLVYYDGEEIVPSSRAKPK